MIEVKDVSFRYPDGTEALRNVSLTIKEGEIVAIMGENGAGKTTLLKHFNGLLKPSRGDVIVDGINTKHASVCELSKKVGIVFQNPDHQLFSPTVEEEVEFALKNFGFPSRVRKRRVDWALRFMGLEKYRKRSPLSLSGGERKRVALAAVLAWSPKYVVLDEPTIGQDYGQKQKLLHLVRQLKEQGKTVIIATHDVEFVAELSPKLVLMSKGEVIAEGSAVEVFSDEELLKRASLLPPGIIQLCKKLGLPPTLDVEELVGGICELLGRL